MFAIDLVFELFHSKQRSVGLVGEQPRMRDTAIDCAERVLDVGTVQRMWFAEDDYPPIVSPDATEAIKTRDKTSSEARTEGYVCKTKGLKQIAWERDLADLRATDW